MSLDDLSIGYGICDVKAQYDFYFKFLLSKCHELFIIEGLPDTVDKTYLLNALFLCGQVAFVKINGNMYCVSGSEGGSPNEYYRPTIYTVANPVLGSKQFKINSDDSNASLVYLTSVDRDYNFLQFGSGGIYQLINQTATLMADNIVSINVAQINSRVQAMVTADTPALRKSGEIAMQRLYDGHPYTILEQNMMDKISVNPINTASNSNSIQQLVELQQFLIAEFYKNLGIRSNAINKRERMITDEINVQDNYVNISYNTMYESIKNGFEEVNRMFGTAITISKPSYLDKVKINQQSDDGAQSDRAVDSFEGDDTYDKAKK